LFIIPIFDGLLTTYCVKILRQNISKSFFLILFLSFFASTSFFDHTHLYDGNIIVHSHPFKPDQDGNPVHKHSDSGYLLIYTLENIIATVVLFSFSSLLILVASTEIIKIINTIIPPGIRITPYLLRGPPPIIQSKQISDISKILKQA